MRWRLQGSAKVKPDVTDEAGEGSQEEGTVPMKTQTGEGFWLGA
jgi:hypothetical protein